MKEFTEKLHGSLITFWKYTVCHTSLANRMQQSYVTRNDLFDKVYLCNSVEFATAKKNWHFQEENGIFLGFKIC